MTRAEKIALLSRVMEGNTEELKKIRATLGRRFTAEEREEQKQYIETIQPGTVTDAAVRSFFGDYDRSDVPGAFCYKLPNGMKLWFT
ncbi:hypothetical protein [Arsenicibacter rosenii]|uniref:Uncharacterized protein n=1 Tax=Arsenicibacter rosenii TaxID=1750698 RepID=A0A1S2VL20_9BACT|nr:hypothetical protein [Arsenicibacter rosenii]OIN59100.1 hypothetical protein BLX24_12915 [Arsenicibacter rosenii]